MVDFSKLSNQDLAESLALMNREYWENFRPDEGVDFDDSRVKLFYEQYSALKEECSRRGVVANSGRLDAKIASVRRQSHLLDSISYWAHKDPSNIFKSEKGSLSHDQSLRFQVRLAVEYAGRERFQSYIRSIRSDEKNAEVRLLGRTYTPETEWSMIYAFLRPNTLAIELGLVDDKTEKEIRACIERAYLSLSHRTSFRRIAGNILWMSGIETVGEYVKGVDHLIEKTFPSPFPDRDLTLAERYAIQVAADAEDRKPEGLLAKILNYENIVLINDSFQNPVFMHWFYEGRLPAYSWSASSGEEMMDAITTGDYRASYDAEKRLIGRAVRDIGEKYV